jgi:SGNH domain (fused to AT3 domains)
LRRLGLLVLVVACLLAGGTSTRAQTSDPDCFGAAARDPLRPCANPALKLSVVPSPLTARKQKNPPCLAQHPFVGKDICEFGARIKGSTGAIAVIGDSHASVWRVALESAALEHGWHGLRFGHASCPMSLATRRIPEPDRSHCDRWRRAVLRWLKDHPEVTTVFVAQLSGGSGVVTRKGQDPFEAEVKGYLAAWKAMPASVQRIYVIRDNPKTDSRTPACIEDAVKTGMQPGPACAVPRREVLDRDAAAVAARRLSSPRVRELDMTRFFCGKATCEPVIGGVLVYKDATHLTGLYARTLGPYLTRLIDASG